MAERAQSSDILATYTIEVASIPMLTLDEEKELGMKALKGDEDAQARLVRGNLRFVINIAKRYKNQGVNLMDLIQAGNIGLMHAARKFDPSVGVKFISYAIYWVSQQIQKEIDGNNGSVRATQTQQVRRRRVRRLQNEARQSIGREYSVEELMAITKYTRDRVVEALNYRVAIKSLDEPVNSSDGSSATLGQVIGAEDEQGLREDEQEAMEIVKAFMREELSDREFEVLAEYFGMHGRKDALSLTEIGEIRSISRERARQLKERGLKKLRAAVLKKPEVALKLKTVFRIKQEVEARLQAAASEMAAPVALATEERAKRAARGVVFTAPTNQAHRWSEEDMEGEGVAWGGASERAARPVREEAEEAEEADPVEADEVEGHDTAAEDVAEGGLEGAREEALEEAYDETEEEATETRPVTRAARVTPIAPATDLTAAVTEQASMDLAVSAIAPHTVAALAPAAAAAPERRPAQPARRRAPMKQAELFEVAAS